MEELKIEYIPLSDIKPYEHNAKLHPDEQVEQIMQSIQIMGFDDPIAIWRNNEIIEGHGRYEAAKRLGMKNVPIIRLDNLTDEQRRAYALIHNKLTMNSGFDIEMLNVELAEIQTIDMGAFDFEIEPIEFSNNTEVSEDDYDEEPPIEPKAKLGDIYQLGRHKLMCGDSTDPAVIDRLMDGVKADMVFTDPPYGMNLDTDYSKMDNESSNAEFRKRKNIVGGKKYEQGKVDEFHPEMIDAVFAIDADEMFLWGADYFSELFQTKMMGLGLYGIKGMTMNNLIKCTEVNLNYVGVKRNTKREIARVRWCGVFGTETEFDHKRHHPTQKPIKLSEWFLKRYSKENQVIVDIFGGSGSTLIACEQLNRKCYMCELDPHYVDVIIDRWEKFTGEKAQKIN